MRSLEKLDLFSNKIKKTDKILKGIIGHLSEDEIKKRCEVRYFEGNPNLEQWFFDGKKILEVELINKDNKIFFEFIECN